MTLWFSFFQDFNSNTAITSQDFTYYIRKIQALKKKKDDDLYI